MLSEINQSVVLNNRNELTVCGIQSVDEFNEDIIIATSLDDMLIMIEGIGMTLKDVNLDKNTFSVSGDIMSFSYSERNVIRKGFFGRIFSRKCGYGARI